MSGMGVGALIGALLLGSASVPPLQNPDFEAGEAGQTPPGWSIAPERRDAGYRFEISNESPQGGGKAGRLWRSASGAARPGAIGVMSQQVDATALRGHRIRYTAAVRVAKPSPYVGLWLRVDTSSGPAFFDNMGDRPISAAAWAPYTIEGYVSQDATTMLLGLQVAGDGDAFIDSVVIEDLGPATGEPTGEAKAYLDNALDLLEKGHINTAKADWPALRAEAYTQAGGATTPAQVHGAIRTVISRLGEPHTFLAPPRKPSMPTATSETPGSPPPSPVAPLPEGRMQGKVAVLALPHLLRDFRDPKDENGARYTAAISAFLQTAETGKTCGWIVDLRGHSGGNMWPGMRGLAPLLGEGSPGAFVGAKGRTAWAATEPAIRATLSHPDAPVAVLMGPRTASSGEMIAIGFVGRPATRSFGQPTAGRSTANSSYPLSDGAVLAVTSSYVEDRLGHRYDGKMIPDETTTPDGAEQAALTWLAGQGCKAD